MFIDIKVIALTALLTLRASLLFLSNFHSHRYKKTMKKSLNGWIAYQEIKDVDEVIISDLVASPEGFIFIIEKYVEMNI